VTLNPWPETDWEALVLAFVFALSPLDSDEAADCVNRAEDLAATMSESQVHDALRVAEQTLGPPPETWCCAIHRKQAMAAIASSSSVIAAFVTRQRRMRMVLAHRVGDPQEPVPYD
jgi:hypothetical protein